MCNTAKNGQRPGDSRERAILCPGGGGVLEEVNVETDICVRH